MMGPLPLFEVAFYRTEAGHEPLRDWLRDLPKGHRRAIGEALLALQRLGPRLGMPLSKSLGRGLHELRVFCESAGYRVFYAFHGRRVILLLHGMEKRTRKTPPEDIALARKNWSKYRQEK